MHIREDIGYSERMGDVGVAALTHLARVAFFRISVCALDFRDFFVVEIGGKLVREYCKHFTAALP
jgi:hypothetical protein